MGKGGSGRGLGRRRVEWGAARGAHIFTRRVLGDWALRSVCFRTGRLLRAGAWRRAASVASFLRGARPPRGGGAPVKTRGRGRRTLLLKVRCPSIPCSRRPQCRSWCPVGLDLRRRPVGPACRARIAGGWSGGCTQRPTASARRLAAVGAGSGWLGAAWSPGSYCGPPRWKNGALDGSGQAQGPQLAGVGRRGMRGPCCVRVYLNGGEKLIGAKGV